MKFTILALLPFITLALAAPVPGDGGSAYTGVGGQADGGDVLKSQDGPVNLDILNFGSDNAGKGGSANSGSALAGSGGCGSGGSGGSAYTGAGGSASGGKVVSKQNGLLNIHALNFGSGNDGDGGSANSGTAISGNGGGNCVPEVVEVVPACGSCGY